MFDPDAHMPALNRGMVYLGACLIARIRLARERQVNVRVRPTRRSSRSRLASPTGCTSGFSGNAREPVQRRYLRYNHGECETKTNCALKGAPFRCVEDGDLMENDLLMLIRLDSDTMAFASLLVSIVGALAAIFAAYYANIAVFYAKKAATKRDLTRVEQNTQHVEHFSNKILSIETPIQPQEKQEDSQAQAQQEPPQPQAARKISPAQQEGLQVQSQREPSPAQVEQQAPLAQVERKAAQVQQKASQVEREASQVQPQREASQAQPQRIPISVEGEALGEVPLELFLTLQDSSVRISRVETLSEAGKILGSSPCKATDNALVSRSFLAPERVSKWWGAGGSTSEGEARSVLRVYLLLGESRTELYRDVPVSIVRGLRNVGITTLVVWIIKGSI